MAHYSEGKAEAAALSHAADVEKYMKPLQPLIDQWEAAGAKVDKVFEEADAQCKSVYARYAGQLASTEGAARNEVLIKYYSDIVSYQREATQQAMQLRINEQMPIAEALEKEMVKIRVQYQDITAALLNYPQLTATQFFTDASRMLEIPEFDE